MSIRDCSKTVRGSITSFVYRPGGGWGGWGGGKGPFPKIYFYNEISGPKIYTAVVRPVGNVKLRPIYDITTAEMLSIKLSIHKIDFKTGLTSMSTDNITNLRKAFFISRSNCCEFRSYRVIENQGWAS